MTGGMSFRRCAGSREYGVFFVRHPVPLPSGVSVSIISKNKTDQFLVPEFLRYSVVPFF